MAFPTYASENVVVTWGGVLLSGFTPDSFITMSRTSDFTETEVGADGDVSISKLPDKTGSVTLAFQTGSDSAKIIAGIVAAQDVNGAVYPATLLVSDPSGRILATLRGAHVMNMSDIDLGSSDSGKSYSFTFFVEQFIFTSTPVGIDGDVAPAVAAGVDTIINLVGNG
jgi:hypothetical protein